MRKTKKIAALLLSSALAISAVGCGNQEVSEKTDASSGTPVASSETKTAESSEVAEVKSAYSSQTLPIVPEGEEKTLTMYVKMSSTTADPDRKSVV